MQLTVRIPVPPELDDPEADPDFDLAAYFQRFVRRELAGALDTDVWELDERAHAYDIQVTHVEIVEDQIRVTYDVLFDAYYGCSDQNYAGEDERTLTGTRDAGHWLFPLHKPRERRNTFEEF